MSRHASRTMQNKKKSEEAFRSASPHELKKTEFSLTALSANSVKLAGDFTNWEKSPLEMTKADNGLWRIEVPLASGNYSYRFIVDGQWCDDPNCSRRIPNPFGTTNGTRQVA